MTTEATEKSSSPKRATTLRERLARADPSLTIPASVAVAEQPPGVRVAHVQPGSLAERAGIIKGELVISMNGEPIRDTVDFYFHGADERLEVLVHSSDGTPRTVRIRKETPDDLLGLEVEQFTTQHCGCNCVFCFVHQLPDNMRKSLYVKDEDYRLSFLQGSYITGTNLKDSDLERIAEQRLSPLYISTHAIDEEIRKYLLGLKKARPIIEVLQFFRKHRIQMHSQIVLCPGVNDGAELQRTLDTLLEFHPTVQSIAIVPLGLTKWRDGLPDLQPVTRDYAKKLLRELKPRLRAIEERFGHPLALLADEWYLIAGLKPPSYSKYPDLPQLENGVGMVYHFYKDFPDARRIMPKALPKPWRVAAITSTLSPPVLDKVVELCRTCEGLTIDVYPTVNSVFGETIHVTGLLTGSDIGRTIKHAPFYDQYLLPGNCLRKYDERFLDDLTLADLRQQTGKLITPVLGGALDFVETILEQAIGFEHHALADHPFLQKHWSNS
jgi:putative radical SAM enzyme (TIGR03279 family)